MKGRNSQESQKQPQNAAKGNATSVVLPNEMDGLLTPVSKTSHKFSDNGGPLLQEISSKVQTTQPASNLDASSLDNVAEVLKSEPDYDTLISVLRTLLREQDKDGGFKIGLPGPQAAKIIQILITEIVPNYWTLLRESSTEDKGSDVTLLLGVLRNLAGLNAILLRIKTLIQGKRAEAPESKRSDIDLNLSTALDLLCEVLRGNDRVQQIWATTVRGLDATKHRILSRELVNIIGGGRIVSLSAEADSTIPQEIKGKLVWIAIGMEYADWLVRNVIAWSNEALNTEEKKLAADLLAKCLRLGYLDAVVKLVVSDLASNAETAKHIRGLYDNLAHSEQRSTLFSVLKCLSNLYLNDADSSPPSEESQVISAAAGIINRLVTGDAKHASHLIAWLTSATGAGLGDSIGIRRAVLAVLACDKDNIIAVFEKSLSQFGDYLYIRHTPMLQQEVHAQVLLLSAGYLKRLAPLKLSLFIKSGSFMQMVSKRLEASQTRARLLGMIVGEALSSLVLNDDKKLNFNMEETTSEEALWLKGLLEVSDEIGSVEPLSLKTDESQTTTVGISRPQQKPKLKSKPTAAKPPPASTVKGIIEVVDSDEEMEDDIIPLKKPDEDDEESDEDPETVRRDRPKAPVYVRNLVAYLRDTENYDRQKLALTTAPVLIRRKANFGTEVQEHAEELATLLVGAQDKFDIENFYELKLQGMIAVVVARPQKMGPWFAKTFFDGDFSVAQRSSVLTVLGLSARELAGFAASEYAQAASFPSQTLPDRMKKLYVENTTSSNGLASSSTLKALPANALDTISKSLTSDFMAPLAANAADAATGPDVLKLSTFTARLEQQKSTTVSKSKTKPRIRAIPNTTAQVIATSFFFPLTARFQSAVHSSAGRARGIIFQPFLLSLYIKTLALLLHAAGPSTLALPDMTTELWSLLLGSSVRAHAVGDLGVTHAMLFALLTILEVNDDRMRDICQTMSREVVETQEWVAQVFNGLRGDDAGGEESQAKALAAGVLVRIQEGMEKYRTLLMGDMIG